MSVVALLLFISPNEAKDSLDQRLAASGFSEDLGVTVLLSQPVTLLARFWLVPVLSVMAGDSKLDNSMKLALQPTRVR